MRADRQRRAGVARRIDHRRGSRSQTCSWKRPSRRRRREAERGAAARALRPPAWGCARLLQRILALGTAQWLGHPCPPAQQRRAARQAAIVVDHAEARGEPDPRHPAPARRAAAPVSWRIASTSPRKPPAAPAWPTESCPPDVLCGNVPSFVSVCERTKSGAFALGAEAEVLELHHR